MFFVAITKLCNMVGDMNTLSYEYTRINKLLKPFHSCIEAIRAHHWQSYADIYTGCFHGCVYCLYRYDDNFSSKILVKENANEILRQELIDREKIGITYIGPSSDVYQPIEGKIKLFRSILEVFIDIERPLFFSTKSVLVKKDIDILQELAAKGLVEVSFTLLGLNEGILQKIEPNAPSVSKRMKAIEALCKRNIPVSLHIAPFLSELFSSRETRDLLRWAKEVGVSHVYGSVLGIRDKYWKLVSNVLGEIDSGLPEQLEKMYHTSPDQYSNTNNAQSFIEETTFNKMSILKKLCEMAGIGFVCEEIPYLTNYSLDSGIYRWKYPTVYDLVEFVKSESGDYVTFAQLSSYSNNFNVWQPYIMLLGDLWEKEKLFLNTCVQVFRTEGELVCRYSSDINFGSGGVGTYE